MFNKEYPTDINKKASLRHPDIVMDPNRLGAMHQTRLSFVRSLTRRMAKQQWQIKQTEWRLCEAGFGHVIYRINAHEYHYHLLIFSSEILDEERNDRVIAEKWDITFALVQGEISHELYAKLKGNVPLQEAGRNSSQVLVLARANKSVRVFEHIVDALSSGSQPNTDIIANVGYLLRTTAVYGNGKFGIADFEILKNNTDFNSSFSAQMCAVYVLRQFSIDWVHYLAKQQGGENAVTLSISLQRYLGIGNATGLGMVPYLINHPKVIDQWLSQRENAIAHVTSQPITAQKKKALAQLLNRAAVHLQQVKTIDPHQDDKNMTCSNELPSLKDELEKHSSWSSIVALSTTYSLETQEVLLTCLLEIYPEIVDQYDIGQAVDESLHLPSGLSNEDILELLNTRYHWATQIDFSKQNQQYWFWYRSKEKEEPRMGIRGEEPGHEREMPLDIARKVNQLYQALSSSALNMPISAFLLAHPHFRHITRRIWSLAQCTMGDIQINLLNKKVLPMHLLRCKLSMFGATKFDPRSDRWVRVTLFQGSPLSHELHEDEWLFPLLPQQETDIECM
ncbi:hypothetical protein [uncultured Shewanella sp.]|uniref:hypothetical protein n=1 Tax=uncultured Shewanella sp. TaxID=173975 RepID=UPI0026027932|nr:hypothetical protein [uncultured Shewanella sp.]